MRYAIFSDIHNHITALEKVLSHAQANNVDRFFCLGDIGIDDCIHLVRQVEAPTVFGNWEVTNWRQVNRRNQQWVLNLPPMRKETDFWLTHATPLWPADITSLADFKNHRHRLSMTHYFPYLHVDSQPLWNAITTLAEAKMGLMFHGHTHRQLIWRFTADNRLENLHARTLTIQPTETVIIGVGSVGRPLDVPGAAYVIYDAETCQVEMIRL